MKINLLLILAFFVNVALATENTTTRYLEKIKDNPEQVLIFLQNMPKGGDLHNHLGGASMAENMMRYAYGHSFCIDRQTLSITRNAQCASHDLLDHAVQDASLYNSLIDAWSMRNFLPIKESGHDHFFSTFGKYSLLSHDYSGEILAEATQRAALQNELYLELMVTPEFAGGLGDQVGWDEDLAALRQKLMAAGINDIVKKVRIDLDNDEKKQKTILRCDTQTPQPGCQMKVRYLFQILRENTPASVFAQLLTGFEVAMQDNRIVGINMVQPEDGYLSMRDYKLHMKMVGFLHSLYPNVHISLHAGELNNTLVPPEDLRFHIRDAVETANAKRIGHGVDIAYEANAANLLEKMAREQIMVEINLTSNADILNVEGKNHPLPLYMQYNVPVALSTDDEGVLRTNLTEQYKRAILTYHFNYPTIKKLVRNSIFYSFLSGENLWQDSQYKHMQPVCAKNQYSNVCKEFLTQNEKASVQWELEKQFEHFENNYK